MNEQNPYADPTTRIGAAVDGPPDALASRWVRLGAAILDGLLILATLLPLHGFGGFLPAAINASRSGYSLQAATLLLWARSASSSSSPYTDGRCSRVARPGASASWTSASSIWTATHRRSGD